GRGEGNAGAAGGGLRARSVCHHPVPSPAGEGLQVPAPAKASNSFVCLRRPPSPSSACGGGLGWGRAGPHENKSSPPLETVHTPPHVRHTSRRRRDLYARGAGSRHVRVLTSPPVSINNQSLARVEMSNIKPLYDRVVIKRVEEEKLSAGGIVIPDSATEKPIK